MSKKKPKLQELHPNMSADKKKDLLDYNVDNKKVSDISKARAEYILNEDDDSPLLHVFDKNADDTLSTEEVQDALNHGGAFLSDDEVEETLKRANEIQNDSLRM